MRKVLICLLCICAVAACKREEKTPILRCGGYDIQMDIAEDSNTMHVNINGDDLDLSLTPSASGAKYVGILNDTEVVLWQKGAIWTLMLDDEQIIDCATK